MKPITGRPVASSMTPVNDRASPLGTPSAAGSPQRHAHRRAASAPRAEPAAQHADDQIVLVVRLRPSQTTAVELLQQRDHPIGSVVEKAGPPGHNDDLPGPPDPVA